MENCGIVVPMDGLSLDTLHALVEEFVTREGTDYGQGEWDLSGKVQQVLAQLRAGKAQIRFDEKTESVTIEAVESCHRESLPRG